MPKGSLNDPRPKECGVREMDGSQISDDDVTECTPNEIFARGVTKFVEIVSFSNHAVKYCTISLIVH